MTRVELTLMDSVVLCTLYGTDGRVLGHGRGRGDTAEEDARAEAVLDMARREALLDEKIARGAEALQAALRFAGALRTGCRAHPGKGRTMNASESLLALLRAARDFTRRAVGAEGLERAAVAHAEARGYVSALGRQARDARIDELEGALRDVVETGEREGRCGRYDMLLAIERARKVLG